MVELMAAQRGSRLHEESIVLLATLLHRHGRIDELRLLLGNEVFFFSNTGDPQGVVALWHQLLPDDAVPRHRLAAWSGQDIPTRADDAYVTYLFDRYAHSFDRDLAGLGYQVPELIAAQVLTTLGPPTGQWQVLDAGCGTGLCGPLVRPYASLLTGVDLSPAMVDKARERGCYDALVVGELTAVLNAMPDTQDLLVSADTLIYFGDLIGVLASITRALRPTGWVAFSLEQAPDSVTPEAYHLNVTGRYRHTAAYVRQALVGAGLRLEVMNTVTIRMDGGKPVRGFVVLAQRPALV
jgi:predicted TPR repeat methyltransferase